MIVGLPVRGQARMAIGMLSTTEAVATDIESNHSFETRWNRFQTILHAIIGGVVAAGLVGVFGNGLLSRATQAFPSAPISLTYERLLRANAPADMVIGLTGQLSGDTLVVDVGSDLLDHVSIASTQPRASAINATPQGVTYTFQLGSERQGSVTFKLSPQRVGFVAASLTAAGARLDLPLFIYP